MKSKVQREVLSRKLNFISSKYVCSPSNKYLIKYMRRNERTSLCILKKGSLTIEAALIVPFFLTILLAFFSLFLQYASAAELKVQAAADAKKLGSIAGYVETKDVGDITIYKKAKTEWICKMPFFMPDYVFEKAVCRAWIGFTELETEETYVYITPEGSVYHLFRDCTHLKLSIESMTYQRAVLEKNEYGEKYRKCKRCKEPFGILVYITKEGDCYHSERNCSGLKRTIRQIAISEVLGRTCCIRCAEREI